MRRSLKTLPLKAVRIFGKQWEIRPKQVNADCGSCEFVYTRININPNQSIESMRDTYLHEITHAVSEEMGLNMTEEQIRGAATGILAVLRDNKALVAFLIA